MPFTSTITETVTIGSSTLEQINTYTDAATISIDEAIADSTTDGVVALVVDVSEIATVLIVCDQAVTLEFNNSTTGVPTIALLAGVPYLWHTNSYHANLLTADITTLYVTNASGSTANLKLRFLYDSTP